MTLPSEFCPQSCLTAQAGGNELICRDCSHSNDISLARPYPILLRTTRGGVETTPKPYTVVGTNADKLIIRDNVGISEINKNSPLIK